MKARAQQLAALLEIDRDLARRGFPPLSAWWRAEAEKFYLHATARRWVARVGRGGSKSTTIAKVATAEVLVGDHDVPDGECHYFTLFSENMSEAANRTRQCDAYLTALGIQHTTVADTIEIPELRRGFKVLACRVGAASGWRSIGNGKDEVAKWSVEGVNPASEIDASSKAMTVTHPNAPDLVFSSPTGRAGFHFDLVEQGTNEHQVVSIAPTWIANPTVTEAQTRTLEPNERIWRREYAAIPQAGELGAFDADAIERAFLPRPPARIPAPVLVIDASSGKSDAWTWAKCGWVDGVLRFELVDGLSGGFWSTVSGDQIIERLARDVCKPAGIQSVHGDQRESLMIRAGFTRAGLMFHEHPWTATNKPGAVERVRRWFAEGRIALPDHAKLRAELYGFEEKLAPSGQFTYGARGGAHDDFVALLITAALADMAGQLRGSPASAVPPLPPDFDFRGSAYGATRALDLMARPAGMPTSRGPGFTVTEVTHPNQRPIVTSSSRRGRWF